jgi:hypothetical protein
MPKNEKEKSFSLNVFREGSGELFRTSLGGCRVEWMSATG